MTDNDKIGQIPTKFRKYRQLMEYTKDQWVDQQHQDVFQWDRNTQNIICYNNELKLIVSFKNDIFHQHQNFAAIISVIAPFPIRPAPFCYFLRFCVVTIFIFELQNDIF